MNSLKLRLIHTHDTEENWNAHPSFIPRAGELIVYDVDDNHSYERFKIGDGVTALKDLKFTIDAAIDALFEHDTDVIYLDGGRII